MFEHSSDVADVAASDLVARDLKEYELDSGKTLSVAQIETVGRAVFERTDELLAAAERHRERHDHVLFALMLTDILAQHTRLLVAGPEELAERAFGKPVGRRRDRAAGRHEPQEAGRAGAAGGGQRLSTPRVGNGLRQNPGRVKRAGSRRREGSS